MIFENQVALITGGSSGIGLALARTLAETGAQVFLAGRNTERLSRAVASLEKVKSGTHHGFTTDVREAEQADRMVQEVIEQAGRLDLLINSAGVVHPGPAHDLPLERFHWMIDINYFGTVNSVQAALPHFYRQGHGKIVNIGSLASRFGVYGYTAYSGSKYAVRGYSDALRMELKPLGIQVHIVFPSDTDTPQLAYENEHKPPELKYLLPELGVASPDQVAQAVLRGIHKGRYEIFTDTGTAILAYIYDLAGGLRYPVLDWFLRRAVRRAAK